MEIIELTIRQLNQGLQKKDFSLTEVLAAYRTRVERSEDKLKAFLTLDWEKASQRCGELEKNKSRYEGSLLYGLPVGIKDVLMTKGWRTTAGSRILDNYVATYTATACERLENAGVVLVGKNNCDEFAMGGSNENSGYYPTHNPYDLQRVPGGSSGGSAASVAARQVVFSLGTDTGGSIRQPAAFCGAVALKPTYGLVSRYGLIAMASSLDSIGPITRTVEDAALVLTELAGHDPHDATTWQRPKVDYAAACQASIKGLKIGLPRQAKIDQLDQKLQSEIEKIKTWLTAGGAVVTEIDMPYLDKALAVYYIIMPAEVSSNLAKFDGLRFGQSTSRADDLLSFYKQTRGEFLGDEVKRRIMIGTYVLSSGYIDAYYLQAQKVRRLISEDCQRALADVDAILLPTTPSTAFAIGEKVQNPLEMYLSDIYTIIANIAGLPAVNVPTDLVAELPYGVQFMGSAFSENKLISLAAYIERTRGELPPPFIVYD